MSAQALESLGLQASYQRPIYYQLEASLQAFLDNPKNNQWVIMVGLRGVGKTTLLSQVYGYLDDKPAKGVYFSLEELTKFPGAKAGHLINAIEQLKDAHPDQPLVLLLDEVHHLLDWRATCKLIYDTVRPLFLVCTGSSAANLQSTGGGIARRSSLIRIPPTSLVEAWQIQAAQNLGRLGFQSQVPTKELRQAIFESRDAREVYQSIVRLEPEINRVYDRGLQYMTHRPAPTNHLARQQMIEACIKAYVHNYQTLPFALAHRPRRTLLVDQQPFPPLTLEQDYRLRYQIVSSIEESLKTDVLKLELRPGQLMVNQYSQLPLDKLPDLLLSLAKNDQTSLNSLAPKMGVDHRTLKIMLQILRLSGLIVEIGPRFKNMGRSTKPSKYLFTAPALRQALIYTNQSDPSLRGSLLEDTVAMYLQNYLVSIPYRVLEYDSRPGGADFVFRPRGEQRAIVIEVGWHKQDSRQVRTTLTDKDLYGLVLSLDSGPRIEEEARTVFIPLSYFLLT